VNRPAAIGADLDTTPSTTTQFDSLDRMLVATSPNGAKVTAGHSMFGTTTIDSLMREREEIRDKDGRTIETIERVDISPAWALPWDRTYDYLHTHYNYGPFEQLTTLTDPDGNVTWMNYDARGNRNGIFDLDAGTRTSQYNGHGELMREIISGDVRTYERDVLGRVKTLQSVDGTQPMGLRRAESGHVVAIDKRFRNVITDYHYDEPRAARRNELDRQRRGLQGLARRTTCSIDRIPSRIPKWRASGGRRFSNDTMPSARSNESTTFRRAKRRTNVMGGEGSQSRRSVDDQRDGRRIDDDKRLQRRDRAAGRYSHTRGKRRRYVSRRHAPR
jgi:YD repeat-containing protein